ncbi:kinase-like domain-containing protein [Choanephora cucurbitarum]|nr:kinase-like domain-containing protein [Choanephora cucurbitarum]
MKSLFTEPNHQKSTSFGPYELLQTLGEGEFGKVKLGVHVETGQEVAVKLIKKERGANNRISKIEREVSILRTLSHPYIVKLHNVIETEKHIGIILEYAPGGELFEHILAHRYLKEKDAKRFFAQLISGVYYMHKRKIVHRDLKLENILLDKNRNIVVTDFGFANQFASAADDMMATTCGSPCYAAPELVINPGLYAGSAVDVWSCGVILYAMLCGFLPFDDDPSNPDSDDINQLYRYILSTELMFPSYVSSEPRNLLKKILVTDPTKRCSLEYIIKHSWLKEYHTFIVGDSQPAESKRNSINSISKSQLGMRFYTNQLSASFAFSSSTKRDSRILQIKESHLPIIEFHRETSTSNEKYSSQPEEHLQKISVFNYSQNHQSSNTMTTNCQVNPTSDKTQSSGPKSVKNDSAIAVMVCESHHKDAQVTPEKSLSSPLFNQPEQHKSGLVDLSKNLSHRLGPEKLMGLLTKTKNIYEVPNIDTAFEETEEDEDDETSSVEDMNKRSEISCTFNDRPQAHAVDSLAQNTDICLNVKLVEEDAQRYNSFDNEQKNGFIAHDLRPKEICPLKLEQEDQTSADAVYNQGVRSFKEAKGLEQRCNFFKSHPINSKLAASSPPIKAGTAAPSSKVKIVEPSISMRVSMSESGKKAIEAVRRSIYRKHKNHNPDSDNKNTSTLKCRLEEEEDLFENVSRPHRNTWAAPPRAYKPVNFEELPATKSKGKKMMDWIRKKSHSKEQKRASIAVVTNLSSQMSGRNQNMDMNYRYKPTKNNTQKQTLASSERKTVSRNEPRQEDTIPSPLPIARDTKEQSEEIVDIPDRSALFYNNQVQSLSETALVKLRKQEFRPPTTDDLKFHQGAIDRTALTTQAPTITIRKLKRVLNVLGIEVREENKFALKCTRRKANTSPNQDTKNETSDDLDLSSISSDIKTVGQGLEPIYGSVGIDNGEEVRFSVEICQIRNLPKLYVVDIRRIKGNAWTYKFLYHKLTGLLNLEQENYIAS